MRGNPAGNAVRLGFCFFSVAAGTVGKGYNRPEAALEAYSTSALYRGSKQKTATSKPMRALDNDFVQIRYQTLMRQSDIKSAHAGSIPVSASTFESPVD